MGSKFWYIPFVFLIMNLFTVINNHAGIMTNKPIIAFDYPVIIIFASLVIAVILEFVYLFVEKQVLE